MLGWFARRRRLITFASLFRDNFEKGRLSCVSGEKIQDALEEAAGNSSNKFVKVHAGEYRPR